MKSILVLLASVVLVSAVFAGCRYLKPEIHDGPGMERELEEESTDSVS